MIKTTANASFETNPGALIYFNNFTHWLCDSAIFAWQFIWNPKEQGTPFVLSSYVANELLTHVGSTKNTSPRIYLEVGAGSGAITQHLLKRLRPQDTLHLVEINPALYEVLKSNIEKIEKIRDEKLSNVFIHNVPIQNWQFQDHTIDVMISTIPFNSLSSPEDLNHILNAYKRFVKPEGVISFAEYVGTSTIGTWIRQGESSKMYEALQRIKSDFFQSNGFDTKIVRANIPPARVIHCKVNTSEQE